MELLAIYNNEGKATEKVIVRGDKNINLNDNEHIAVSIIFIENSKGEFLIQKTSKEKGGKYSSTGGHVISGETPIESIKREVKEELGIEVENENIESLGYLLYDKPIRFMFYLKKDIDVNKLNIQKEEVEYIEFMTIDQINKLRNEDLMLESHSKVFNKILEYKIFN